MDFHFSVDDVFDSLFDETHPLVQFVNEMDRQIEIIANAEEKLKTLKDHYPTDDDIPF